MAAITATELYGNPGAVWNRVVALFDMYLLDSSLAWTSAVVGATYSSRSVTVVITGAVDVTTYILVDINTPSTLTHSLFGLFAFPNMNRTNRMLNSVYLGRNISAEFLNKLRAIKKLMVAAWTGGTFRGETVYTSQLIAGLTFDQTVSATTYQLRQTYYTDTMSMATRIPAAGFQTPGEVDIGAASIVPNTTIALEAVDVAGIVTALNDVARRDVATSIDNGNVTVYNYSGDIVEPP